MTAPPLAPTEPTADPNTQPNTASLSSAAGSPLLHLLWTRWRKPLAKLSLLVGLILLVAQGLPALPQQQHLTLQAPLGFEFTQVDLAYFDDDGAPLAGTRLRPAGSAQSLRHSLSLSDGRYQVTVTAELVASPAPHGQHQASPVRSSVQQQLALELNGSTQVVRIDPTSSKKR